MSLRNSSPPFNWLTFFRSKYPPSSRICITPFQSSAARPRMGSSLIDAIFSRGTTDELQTMSFPPLVTASMTSTPRTGLSFSMSMLLQRITSASAITERSAVDWVKPMDSSNTPDSEMVPRAVRDPMLFVPIPSRAMRAARYISSLVKSGETNTAMASGPYFSAISLKPSTICLLA